MHRFYAVGDRVYYFSRAKFERALQNNRRLPQQIGISRQAAHQYCRGELSPRADRAVLIYDLAPSCMIYIGKLPNEEV